jgi:hypothetical protein
MKYEVTLEFASREAAEEFMDRLELTSRKNPLLFTGWRLHASDNGPLNPSDAAARLAELKMQMEMTK